VRSKRQGKELLPKSRIGRGTSRDGGLLRGGRVVGPSCVRVNVRDGWNIAYSSVEGILCKRITYRNSVRMT